MKIGEYNYLRVLRFTSIGLYLGDKDGNDILLPHKYKPDRVSLDEELKVFVYIDSEDRPIATNLTPKITVNTFASLKVKEVSSYGAFLDWGLEKDLLVPYREQKSPMKEGYWYIVYLYLDKDSDRLVATTKLDPHFSKDTSSLKQGAAVDILIGESSPLGVNAIVNNKFKGLLYANELTKPVRLGEQYTAYLKTVRDDGKVDLSLSPLGAASVEPNANIILEKLTQHNGLLQLGDDSSPEEIEQLLQMSKKAFKKALGTLYKQKRITISPKEIALVNEDATGTLNNTEN